MIGRWRCWRALQSIRARAAADAARGQHDTLLRLVQAAVDTPFGREHHFGAIATAEDFRARVPLGADPLPEAPFDPLPALEAYLARARDRRPASALSAFVGERPARCPGWVRSWTGDGDLLETARALRALDVRLLWCRAPQALALLAAVENEAGLPIRDVWPAWRGLVHGGVDFVPYAPTFRRRAGEGITFVETWKAPGVGLLAVQDGEEADGLALLTGRRVFFEFVGGDARRIGLAQAVPGVVYDVYLTAPGGVWARRCSDKVRFLSTRPPRVVRVDAGLNAFGEELDAEALERAVARAAAAQGGELRDFAVTAEYPDAFGHAGRHLWLVEFSRPPGDLAAFAQALDASLLGGSARYARLREKDLVVGPPRVRLLRRETLARWRSAQRRQGLHDHVVRAADQRDLLAG